MTNEDTGFWEKPKDAKPKRRRIRKYRSVRDLQAEIRELKAALKVPDPKLQAAQLAKQDAVDQRLQKEHDHAFASGPAAKEKRVVETPLDDSMFDGLEPGSCATRCGHGFCVITHTEDCAHPLTSPLQQSYFGNREVMERYIRAKKYCAKMRLDKLLETGLGM